MVIVSSFLRQECAIKEKIDEAQYIQYHDCSKTIDAAQYSQYHDCYQRSRTVWVENNRARRERKNNMK